MRKCLIYIGPIYLLFPGFTFTTMSALAEEVLKGESGLGKADGGTGESGASAGAAGATAGVCSKDEDGCTLVAKWQGKTIELPELAKSTTIGEVKVGG